MSNFIILIIKALIKNTKIFSFFCLHKRKKLYFCSVKNDWTSSSIG